MVQANFFVRKFVLREHKCLHTKLGKIAAHRWMLVSSVVLSLVSKILWLGDLLIIETQKTKTGIIHFQS